MYITFVLQDLYRGGAEYVTAILARELVRRGHRVDIVVSAVHNKIKQERQDIRPYDIPKKVNLFSLPHLRSSRNVLSIHSYLRIHRPDVVVPMSSNYEPPCALACSLIAKKIRPKLVPVEHSGGIGILHEDSKIPSDKKWFGYLYSLLPIKRADHCIAVSKGVAEAMVKVGRYKPDEISVIYNPVVDETFWKNHNKEAHHPWLVNKSYPVVVAAGSHVSLKGYGILIRAMSQVLLSKKCRLIIFGEGPDTANLKLLAKELNMEEFISFPGHIDALPAELKNADVFVVSSHVESFSIVLVEALVCGVPVVSTNCPVGPPEILQNGRHGILVKPNDPNELAKGILAVLNGGAVIPSKESWKPYVVENVVTQYEKILNRILD
jgi:glycosyltransferase involved in cell wall biosynthesis